MIPWKETVDVRGNVPIGETIVDLQKEPCTYEECNLGNFYCDAAIYSVCFRRISLFSYIFLCKCLTSMH